ERVVNEGITLSAGGEQGGKFSRVEVIDLDTVPNRRVRRPPSPVWGHQHDRRLTLDIGHPGWEDRRKVENHAPSIAGSMTRRQLLHRSSSGLRRELGGQSVLARKEAPC